MGMKALIVLLVATSACSGLNIELKIQNDPQCMFKGQQCSQDLTNIIYCTAKGGDSLVVATCQSGKQCVLESGKYICSKKNNQDVPNEPTGNNTVFTCQGNEAYPDPNRCNTAYLCQSVGHFPEVICECPKDAALIFSPGMTCTTEKDVKNDCKCPTINRCKDGLGAGAFGNCHAQYYYMCRYDPSLGIVPEVYKCPPGQYFFEGKCQNAILNIQVADESGSDPVCKKYHPPCFLELNVKCSKKGELLHHGRVDRCYYSCDSNLKPMVKDCGIGSYFTCKYGQCGCVFGPRIK